MASSGGRVVHELHPYIHDLQIKSQLSRESCRVIQGLFETAAPLLRRYRASKVFLERDFRNLTRTVLVVDPASPKLYACMDQLQRGDFVIASQKDRETYFSLGNRGEIDQVTFIPFEGGSSKAFDREMGLRVRLQRVEEVVGLKYVVKGGGTGYLIENYLNFGDLGHLLLYDLFHSTFRSDLRMVLILDVAKALRAIHREYIVHGNVEPSSIFFHLSSNGDFFAKMGRFSSAFHEGDLAANRRKMGDPIFIAPEVIRGENFTYSSDMWSFGIVLMMILGCPIEWMGNNEEETLQLMDGGSFRTSIWGRVAIDQTKLKNPKDYPLDLYQLAWDLLAFDPIDRPDAEQVLSRIEAMCLAND